MSNISDINMNRRQSIVQSSEPQYDEIGAMPNKIILQQHWNKLTKIVKKDTELPKQFQFKQIIQIALNANKTNDTPNQENTTPQQSNQLNSNNLLNQRKPPFINKNKTTNVKISPNGGTSIPPSALHDTPNEEKTQPTVTNKNNNNNNNFCNINMITNNNHETPQQPKPQQLNQENKSTTHQHTHTNNHSTHQQQHHNHK